MENPDGASNRIFIIAVIGLVALLMIGLLSVAGLVIYTRFLVPAATPTLVAEATATPVPSATPTAVRIATPTAEAPTATRVVEPGASPTPGEPSPTATPAGGDEIPDTGFGPLEAVAGGVILLVLILLVRRLRLTGRT